jgi:hypothetical protein
MPVGTEMVDGQREIAISPGGSGVARPSVPLCCPLGRDGHSRISGHHMLIADGTSAEAGWSFGGC